MPTKSARAKSSHGWKVMQSRIKVKKRTKLALAVLGLIIALLILGKIVNLTQTLFSPWKVESSSKNYLWSEQFSINILLHTNPISVFSYHPKEQKITIVKIPNETYIEVPGGFGSWQVRSIYDLGQTSKVGGNKLLKQSLSSFLGIPVEGLLQPTGSLEQKGPQELIELLRKSPFNMFTLLSDLKTDLTLWEFIRLNWALSSVRFDKVKILDLLNLNVLDKKELADGSVALSADSVRIDSVLSDFQDYEIQKEHLSIAVFNATSYPLLAQKAARLITNMGGNVIIVNNSPKILQKTLVSGQESATLKRLIQIFGCDNCDKIEHKNLNLDSSRSQINLFLGEDFHSRL